MFVKLSQLDLSCGPTNNVEETRGVLLGLRSFLLNGQAKMPALGLVLRADHSHSRPAIVPDGQVVLDMLCPTPVAWPPPKKNEHRQHYRWCESILCITVGPHVVAPQELVQTLASAARTSILLDTSHHSLP